MNACGTSGPTHGRCHLSTLAGHCPQVCVTILNEHISWANDERYVGCNFLSRTVDLEQGIGKFFGEANKIFSVLIHTRNKLMALYLVKSNCLPALSYNCEVWSLADSDLHILKVAWNHTFRKIFSSMACWRER